MSTTTVFHVGNAALLDLANYSLASSLNITVSAKTFVSPGMVCMVLPFMWSQAWRMRWQLVSNMINHVNIASCECSVLAE